MVVAHVRRVIMLTGSIGAGKTTLGCALARTLAGSFIDGDDHVLPGRPWYASSLRTSRAIAKAAISASADFGDVVVAYPLRCINWIYYRRRFAEAGAGLMVVNLHATFEQIVSPERGRIFDDRERRRIEDMIHQGYGARQFAVATVDTGSPPFAEALVALVKAVRR